MSRYLIYASNGRHTVTVTPDDCRHTWEAPSGIEALKLAVGEREKWAAEQLCCRTKDLIWEIEEEF